MRFVYVIEEREIFKFDFMKNLFIKLKEEEFDLVC